MYPEPVLRVPRFQVRSDYSYGQLVEHEVFTSASLAVFCYVPCSHGNPACTNRFLQHIRISVFRKTEIQYN